MWIKWITSTISLSDCLYLQVILVCHSLSFQQIVVIFLTPAYTLYWIPVIYNHHLVTLSFQFHDFLKNNIENFCFFACHIKGFGGSAVKNKNKNKKKILPIQKTWVQSLGWKDTLEKEMGTHSSILAWAIPWTEESGGLQFSRSQKTQTWLSDSRTMLLQNKCFKSVQSYDIV